MPLLKRTSYKAWPLRYLTASAVGLYLLVNAFLILCLAHPHNPRLQGHTDSHPVSVCEWVYKTVSSHMPSSGVTLPLVAVVLPAFLLLPRWRPETYLIRLSGRSPPLPILL
ncbi:hypothetical protein MELA_00996 [Candidatus Methylomirabilis lanthanidiphila]|uniref:Uncharacterized protein n=1 Tax=Candidatus Methylomirabilis lanthanidiphila TaxID=2211376 RepID=A0A564ZHI7_9BACT|nr:hypothetical protein MELA_00996 [Candidatus Methylomirabilis lanthanidiphila]